MNVTPWPKSDASWKCPERVRQVELQALRKLRLPVVSRRYLSASKRLLEQSRFGGIRSSAQM